DPKAKESDRKWHPFEADLTRFKDGENFLFLETTPGPRENNAWDWAAWGDLHLEYGEDRSSPLQLVYDKDIKVYENTRSLNRAFLVSNVVSRSDDNGVVEEMKRPDFDPAQEAVVIGSETCAIAPGGNDRLGTAKVASYGPDKVEID